jgi:glycosyltransferase involved in cell wall biosynthesis
MGELESVLREMGPRVLVVVPAMNEEPIIGAVVAGLRSSFEHVLVVDDGSLDATASEARSSGARVIRHPFNLGQGAALRTGITYGLRAGRYEEFVTFDADGQHRVEDAVQLVRALRGASADIVLGSRFLEGRATSVPPVKRLVLRAARHHSNRQTGLALTDSHNGLRAFRRDVAEALRLRHSGMAHASEITRIVAEQGFTVTEVPVTVDYTAYSRSKGQATLNAVNILFDLYWRR